MRAAGFDAARYEPGAVPELRQHRGTHLFGYACPVFGRDKVELCGKLRQLLRLQDKKRRKIGRFDDALDVERRRVVPATVVAMVVVT